VPGDIDEVPKNIVSLREALEESARHVSRHLLQVWAQAVAGVRDEVVVEIEADRRLGHPIRMPASRDLNQDPPMY
jgi:hypothetical protein